MGRGNPTEIANYSFGIFTPIQIRVIWPTHQYWAFRESKMSNPTNDILSQCCESYRCFKAIHNNCWWNDERGANVSCTTKRGANSGNNANADYKIFKMLAQSQDKLLHISYSTKFHTTTLEYTHKLYKAWKLEEVNKFLKNILKNRKKHWTFISGKNIRSCKA